MCPSLVTDFAVNHSEYCSMQKPFCLILSSLSETSCCKACRSHYHPSVTQCFIPFFDEIHSAGISGIGIFWLIFLHWDIQRYKKRLLKKMRPRGMSSVSMNPLHSSSIEDIEVLSTSTEMIFFQMNGGKHLRVGERPTSMGSSSFPALPLMYRFLKGRHTASFYLKCGMAGS